MAKSNNISLAILSRLRYNFQDNQIWFHSRLEDRQFWVKTYSRSFEVTGQHLGDSCIVATRRTSFGRHIRLGFRYCAHLPDRFRRSPAQNDKFVLSRSNVTFIPWSWSVVKFWPWRYQINTHMFGRLSMRGTRWQQNYLDISFSSIVIGETRFLPKKTTILICHHLQALSVGVKVNSDLTLAK